MHTLLVGILSSLLTAGLLADVGKNDVKKLLQAGIGEQTIVQFIRKNGPADPLSVEDITELRDAGATDAVINAMLDASRTSDAVTRTSGSPDYSYSDSTTVYYPAYSTSYYPYYYPYSYYYSYPYYYRPYRYYPYPYYNHYHYYYPKYPYSSSYRYPYSSRYYPNYSYRPYSTAPYRSSSGYRYSTPSYSTQPYRSTQQYRGQTPTAPRMSAPAPRTAPAPRSTAPAPSSRGGAGQYRR
jgi:hypothetical protein